MPTASATTSNRLRDQELTIQSWCWDDAFDQVFFLAGQLDMSEPTPVRLTRKCPICGKAALHRFRPFCSKRCADVDLNRWLSGRYCITKNDPEEELGPRPTNDDEG